MTTRSIIFKNSSGGGASAKQSRACRTQEPAATFSALAAASLGGIPSATKVSKSARTRSFRSALGA